MKLNRIIFIKATMGRDVLSRLLVLLLALLILF